MRSWAGRYRTFAYAGSKIVSEFVTNVPTGTGNLVVKLSVMWPDAGIRPCHTISSAPTVSVPPPNPEAEPPTYALLEGMVKRAVVLVVVVVPLLMRTAV